MQAFNQKFEALSNNEIPFNPSWPNGTGYLDGVVKDRTIEKIGRSVDPHGRKIILVPTPVGTVAVFQRFKNNESVFVHNAPETLRRVFPLMSSGALSEEDIFNIIGDEFTDDVGVRLHSLVELAKKLGA